MWYKNSMHILLWRSFFLFFCLTLCSTACQPRPQRQQRLSAVAALSESPEQKGFARAREPRSFSFPADDGPHYDFQTEWWYYTGHLYSGRRRFGYQFTLFRRGLTPGPDSHADDWRTNQIYFAHFTLSDIQNQAFYPFERWGRASVGLAGAQSEPFRVWLHNWSLSGDPQRQVKLQAHTPDIELSLDLRPQKREVLQGNQGLSQKNAGEGNASYYYSRPRIQTQGRLRLKDEYFTVQGESWLDREWSTSVLAPEQQGWDWFSLQFEDGSELMLYQLRLKDGSLDRYSSGSLIDVQGGVTPLKAKDFSIQSTGHWTSPETGVRYPSGWTLRVPRAQLDLTVRPLMPNQELPLSFTYWEGAVSVEGDRQGQGYVELTGYETP